MLDYLGNPYDTSELETTQAGRGFAICAFVKDGEEGDFLAHSHTLRRFHHSSFFAGEPVHFAGEIKVIKGRLEVLTHKSGHYKPTETQLVAMLRFLRNHEFDLSEFECWVFNSEKCHQSDGEDRYDRTVAQTFFDKFCQDDHMRLYSELALEGKGLTNAAVDVTDLPSRAVLSKDLTVADTGYDSYRTVNYNETHAEATLQVEPSVHPQQLAVAGALKQPPVGPALEQLAEEFTHLAWQGKLLTIQEMNHEKTREFEGKFDVINIQNARQQTALYCAARQGHIKVVKYLLKYGAKPNLREQHGSTPLHAAAYAGHKDCCMSLLSWKADASIKNKFRLSALDELRLYS